MVAKLEGSTRGKPGTLTKTIPMITKTIDNPALPLGCYVQQIHTDEASSNWHLVQAKKQANLAIQEYSNAKANKENCQKLQEYLRLPLAECESVPVSEDRDEVIEQLTNIIDTLQTGINRVSSYKDSPNWQDKKNTWESYSEKYQRCIAQYKVTGYKQWPITYDPKTVEGYIRRIKNVEDMDIDVFVKSHSEAIIKEFYPFTKKVIGMTDKQFEKWFDANMASIIKKFAFVKLTTKKEQVVENQYEGAQELYDYVQELGMEQPTETVVAK